MTEKKPGTNQPAPATHLHIDVNVATNRGDVKGAEINDFSGNLHIHGENAQIQTIIQRAQEKQPTEKEIEYAWKIFETLPVDQVPDIDSVPSISRMPYAANTLFVGRTDELIHISNILKKDVHLRQGSTAVITGIGGIGKSQLANAFVHRYGKYFTGGVFWMSFAEAENVPSEVAACGESAHLNLDNAFSLLPTAEQARLVTKAWQQPLPRLLIFDNCEDESLFNLWRPKTGGAHVIVTSRRANWDPALNVNTLPVDILPRAKSIALLRLFRPDLEQENQHLDAIANLLGDHPLALHLAGSFLKLFVHSPAGKPVAYLQQLQDDSLLDHPSLSGEVTRISPTGHDLNVARTFSVSFKELSPDDPIDIKALDLLSYIVYLAPGEIIPRMFLLKCVTENTSTSIEQLKNEQAIHRLAALGLVEIEPDGSLEQHRLLNQFLRKVHKSNSAINQLANTFWNSYAQINTETGNLKKGKLLEVHLRHFLLTEEKIQAENRIFLTGALGYYSRLSGDLDKAEMHFMEALHLAQELWGATSSNTAIQLNNLGYLYMYKAEYEKSLPFLEKSLALNQDDQHTLASTIDNLGQLYGKLNQPEKAIEYYRKALKIRTEWLGPQHHRTAITLHNIGSYFSQKGNYEEALRYLNDSLEAKLTSLKPPNKTTADTLNALGMLHKEMGTTEEAIEYFTKSAQMYKAVVGEQHYATLQTASLLAAMLLENNSFAAVASLLEEYAGVFDIDEVDNEIALNNIGISAWLMGNYNLAYQYYNKLLNLKGATEENATDATLLNNIGMLHLKKGDYVRAVQLLTRAVMVASQQTASLTALKARFENNLGVALLESGTLEEAEKRLNKALADRILIHGEKSREVATTINNLGRLYQAKGELDLALEKMQDALAMAIEILHKDHIDVGKIQNDLGMLLLTIGDLDNAHIALNRALAIRESSLPEQHPDLAVTLFNVAQALVKAHKTEDVRPFLERALQIFEDRLGADNVSTIAAQTLLANL